ERGADIVIMLHPDYQYDSRAIPYIVGFVRLGICDLMLGSRIRTRREALEGGMPLLKYLMNRVLTLCMNVVLGQNLGDCHSGFRVVPGGERPPFEIDEAHKLSESYYYHLFFEQGAWRHADWQADFYARTNPPVAKYVFGAALAAAGLHVHDRRLQDDFAALWRTPDALRRKVPDAMLRVTRGVSVTYGALVCALLFWIGQRMAGLLAGILAASLLLANPSFLQTARGGLTDTILLFHLTLIVPASLCGSAPRTWASSPCASAS